MRRGKAYDQFPGFWLAPNGFRWYGIPLKCSWQIYLNGHSPPGDQDVRIEKVDVAIEPLVGKCRWLGDFIHGGLTWGCEFWTRVLPTSPAVEFGVHIRRSDGAVIDVLADRVLSDSGLWSPGGGFINPTPSEWVLPPEYASVRFIGVRPTQYREEL